jgi:hypothetical protein
MSHLTARDMPRAYHETMDRLDRIEEADWKRRCSATGPDLHQLDQDGPPEPVRQRVSEVLWGYTARRSGVLSWEITHPTERNRSYTVNLAERTCTCPAWRSKKTECKHLSLMRLAYRLIHGREPERKKEG